MDNFNEQAINAIVEAIATNFNMQKNKLLYDKSVQGRITAILNNKYNVAIQGAEYTSVPCSVDITFTINEGVWITLPQGDWSDMFICGRRI